MKITTDSFFSIGKHHVVSCVPCQDYAHSGMLLNGIHYAGLADGCSSSEDSDLGARALIHWFRIELRRRLKAWPADRLFGTDEKAYLVSKFVSDIGPGYLRMGSPQCMDATFNFAFLHRSFEVGFVLLQGDGAIAFKKKGEDIPLIMTMHWDESMPPYLSYNLDDEKREDFKNYAIRNKLQGHLTSHSPEGGAFEVLIPSWRQVDSGPMIIPFNIAELEMIAVFSDGVDTFQAPGQHPSMTTTVVRSLMDIPSFTPGFVKRSYNRLIRSCRKANVDHTDDFSMAAIRIDHDAAEETAVESGAVKVKSGTIA